MVNNNPMMQLTLKMADLWIRHMAEAESDPEIEAELQQVLSMRSQVETIYNDSLKEQITTDSAPDTIRDYLLEKEPTIFPIEISVFNEKPRQYLITTKMPMSRSSANTLDEMFPEMIVLDQAPW